MKETAAARRPQRERKENAPRMKGNDNVIFVGKKPTMAYVLAVMTQFDRNKQVVVKARGKAISHAVDVVEAVRNKFARDAKPTITIGTESVTDSDGKRLNISTIEIALTK